MHVVRVYSLVSQLLFCHHHLHNMPESLILHLLAVFCDVANADASDFPHVLRRELKRVSGTAVEGCKRSVCRVLILNC